MKKKKHILVIDDELEMQDILKQLLQEEGYELETANSGEEGLDKLLEKSFDLVICDIMMAGIGGIKTLERIKEIDQQQMVIMITSYASIENAVDAMKKGAFEYITRPFRNDEVLHIVNNAVKQKELIEENFNLREVLKKKYRFENIIGKNEKMSQVFKLIRQAAPSKSTILIQGESGTGKELVAIAIHQNSPRANNPFVVVNSGNVPPDLLESNLFGHVKGAFTGAVNAKKGLFEVADGGSIFFDEIGTISLETQAKLLRVIQEKEFMRLGGVETMHVDVRIIAATNIDLKYAVEKGEFREDLYYRLNVINISLPTLRDRKDDIPLLANHFIEKYCIENNKKIFYVDEKVIKYLINYDWPGNIRELENVIERAVVLNNSDRLDLEFIPQYIIDQVAKVKSQLSFSSDGIYLKKAVSEYEKSLIINSLIAAKGIQKKAAKLLKLKPTTLNEKIKRYNINIEEVFLIPLA
jgi:two-component system response regulator PilR (NtrC family)